MKSLGLPPQDAGTFANGMEFLRFGDGDRVALWLPGGPGSELPSGWAAALQGRQVRPLVDAGFSVWMISRRRHMPSGHGVAEMAADCAALVTDEFAGQVELVVGLSYGGMIAQYLAAEHPGVLRRLVIALSAVRITDWGREVDARAAQARVDKRHQDAGEAVAEYVFPQPDQQWQRRLVGAVMGLALSTSHVPDGDLLVEAQAEMVFDATEVLPHIAVPTLILHAEQDMFFTPEIIQETAALIPDCRVITYPGQGHMRASVATQIAVDAAEFCG